MPIYTYLCKKCSQKHDFLVGMNQEKQELKCPSCGGKNLEKQFVLFGISSNSPEKSSSSHNCGSCSGGSCSSCH
ncbi:MAG: zinc ribbon domain-containing protein [Candidatus Omnitrophota bacterium]|nr:zinc ribbon domain-containing protein [Candidatus Omnitrophota bacterium]